MRLEKVVSILDEIAPQALADEMDAGKIGLVLKGRQEVRKLATALDPTPGAIKKAIDAKADLLVTHHALIWEPVATIDDGLARKLRLLLESGMSLYTMHTNFDRAIGGVNDTLASVLGVDGLENDGNVWHGFVEEMSLRDFSRYISGALGCPAEYIGSDKKKIRKLALVGGSGFRLGLETAKGLKVDALLSSELKHDVIRDAGDIALVSVPHYHAEAPAMRALADRLSSVVASVFIDDAPDIKVVKG